MPAASEPLTPATTVLKLSKVPSAICRAVPPFGASALTYSKCLNPAEYFRSPNDDTPCRQFLSLARAALIQSDHVSGRTATASRIEPSSDLRFIRPSSFNPSALICSLQRLIKLIRSCGDRYRRRHPTVYFSVQRSAASRQMADYVPLPYSATLLGKAGWRGRSALLLMREQI